MCHHLWTPFPTNAHLDSSFLCFVLKNSTAANNLIYALYVFSVLLDNSTLPPHGGCKLEQSPCKTVHGHKKTPVSPHPQSHTSFNAVSVHEVINWDQAPREEWYQPPKSWSPAKSLCDQFPLQGQMRRILPILEFQFPTGTYLILHTIQRCLIESQNIWDGTLHHLNCSLSFTESRISHRFWLEGPLTTYLNKKHLGNKMQHSTNTCTSDSLTLLWINIWLSCCWEQCSPFCLVSQERALL